MQITGTCASNSHYGIQQSWIQLRSAILGIMRPLALFQQKTLHGVFCS